VENAEMDWKYRQKSVKKGSKGWKMREWKNRHGVTEGGKCRSQKRVYGNFKIKYQN